MAATATAAPATAPYLTMSPYRFTSRPMQHHGVVAHFIAHHVPPRRRWTVFQNITVRIVARTAFGQQAQDSPYIKTFCETWPHTPRNAQRLKQDYFIVPVSWRYNTAEGGLAGMMHVTADAWIEWGRPPAGVKSGVLGVDPWGNAIGRDGHRNPGNRPVLHREFTITWNNHHKPPTHTRDGRDLDLRRVGRRGGVDLLDAAAPASVAEQGLDLRTFEEVPPIVESPVPLT